MYNTSDSRKDRESNSKINRLSCSATSDMGSEIEEDSDSEDDDNNDKKTGESGNLSEYSTSDEDEGDEPMDQDENDTSVPWSKKYEDMSDTDYSDDGDLQDTDLKWKENLAEKAATAFIDRQATKADLWKLVYGDTMPSNEEEDDDKDMLGGLFKVVSKTQEHLLKEKDKANALDTSKFPVMQMKDWTSAETIESIKDCFVTGKWKEDEDADELLKLDDLSDDEADEVYGDFEDLETGEKFVAEDKDNSNKDKEVSKKELLEKKKKLKEKFDKEYDNKDDEESYFEELKLEASKQAQLNRSQFEGLDDKVRVEIEGYRAGMYVRLEVSEAPCELIDNFDATYPLVVGGLQPGEQNIGFVKVRIKKHRWYKKILKTKDPLLISMGWRRFQTVAVYSKQEDNMRHRMLKYTPEHLACMGHFWGPSTTAGTGFLAMLDTTHYDGEPGFRILATGSVVDTNQSTTITKKLKLIGTPSKIYKKTAFIKGMFNSALEVAKFEGAKIKTVSGIRGQIKKPVNKPEGMFRATFEDKILLSDIVFCRTWYRIDVPKMYFPMTTLLLPASDRGSWKGMRTLGTIKREMGLRNEAQPDSMYTEIKRPPKVSRPMIIPRALEKELPYRLKTKQPIANNTGRGAFMKKVQKIVVRDEHETKVARLITQIKVNYAEKQKKLQEATRERIEELKKRKEDSELRKVRKHKEIKKSIYRTLSKMESKREKKN